jgi:hypothetical protein
MEVHLRSESPGSIRALTYRGGVPRSVIYPSADAVAYEPVDPPADEPTADGGDEAREGRGRFAGWYRIPRVGAAAVYGAIVEGVTALA